MSIGERIKLARKIKGLSLDMLAQQVSVSKMAISKYERDQDVPGSAVLLELSGALEVPVEFFFRPSFPQVTLRAYRKRSSLGIKEQEAIQAQIQEWLERYLEIETFFPQHSQVPPLPHYDIHTLDEVEDAARNLRAAWELGLDAIENLMELLEDRHIKIGLIETTDHFDACTFLADGSAVIVTRAGLPGDRQRFNLAHELGHLVLQIAGNLDEEKAAHRFAGAFLVPDSTARYELGSERHTLGINELYLLKHKYGLSMQAWVARASALGIISETAALNLYKTFAHNGWKKTEPGEQLPPEKPLRMQRLVYRALAEDIISPSRAEEFLAQPVTAIKAASYDVIDSCN